MTQTPLQQLTAKIYASNPELMTLGVGCELELITKQSKFICTIIDDSDVSEITKDTLIWFKWKNSENKTRSDFFYKKDIEEKCEIIGKPPTLVDVLKWMKTLSINQEKEVFSLLYAWNLNSIYLRDQSPELINFLINL